MCGIEPCRFRMMDDPVTRMTMVALMARWNLAARQRVQQQEVLKAAETKIKECTEVVEQCIKTCKALGFDRSNEESWDRALSLYGAEASALYNKARDPSYPPWIYERPLLELTAETAEEPAPVLSTQDAHPPATTERPVGERPPIKEIALERLRVAAEAGAKAAEIRDYIHKTYGGEIHEKTVGMTLYRLLKDGKVRRDKHTWFIAPEAMNPGAGTPGS